MKSRSTHNRIISFIDNGVRIDDFNRVVEHFLGHFKAFMGMDSLASGVVDPKIVSLGNALTIDQQVGLIKPFTILRLKRLYFILVVIKALRVMGLALVSSKLHGIWLKVMCILLSLSFFNTCKLP